MRDDRFASVPGEGSGQKVTPVTCLGLRRELDGAAGIKTRDSCCEEGSVVSSLGQRRNEESVGGDL